MARQSYSRSKTSIKKRRGGSRKKPYSRDVTYNVGGGNRASIVRLNRGDYGFPDRLITKMKYADVYQFTLNGLGTASSNAFRMNSIYDPDHTGTGHQPMWHDQFAVVYSKYRVLGSKIKAVWTVRSINGDETGIVGPWVCGLAMSQTPTLTANTSTALMEYSDSQSRMVTDRQGGSSEVTLYGRYSPKKDLGFDKTEPDVGANFGANPTTGFYAIPWVVDPTTVNSSIAVLTVEIEYLVEVFEAKQPDQS